jgi:uncharacterized protein YecT (DUF1311 family)
VRRIAPDQFAPVYGDPSAPAHKPAPAPSPPPPPPRIVKPKPPPPPPPIPPSREKPFGACVAGAVDWIACLGVAAELADRSVEQEEHEVLASLPGRPGVNPLIAEGAARSLRAAGEAWRMLRDRECADLTLVESGLDGGLYERRLRCRISRDIDRAEFLRGHYGAAD